MEILRGINNAVELEKVKVPDLWHIHLELKDMHRVPAAEAVLETWRLAEDLLAKLRYLQSQGVS